MGYAVYQDNNSFGVERWAGYGVPAVCDVEDCTRGIDRGLYYQCEEYSEFYIDANEDEIEEVLEGCGLFFCVVHLNHLDHGRAVPKPDSAEWNQHILTDESWQQWRDENPEKVALLKQV